MVEVAAYSVSFDSYMEALKLWVFFWVPIVVSCYQIGPGYISAILNNPKVKLYFTGSVGDRTERLMVLICSGPDC